MIRKILSRVGMAVAVISAFLVTLWLFGALCFDGPGIWLAAIAILCLLAVMIWQKFRWRAWAAWGTCVVSVLAWWLLLKPPAAADWQADVAQITTAQVDGDDVTFSNVRDFDYRSETDFTPRWITRKVRLSALTGVDIAINYWGSPWMAHPIISFRFSDAPPLSFSIETRKRRGQVYSAIGGLYRQFNLVFIVAEERDVLGVRAVHRKGEDVYLYRTTLTPAQARVRLLEYIATVNSLASKPRWYNAVTTNCTTAIRTQHPGAQRLPLDWRILVNGKGDEMLFERGVLVSGGLTFSDLKRSAHVNSIIKSADGQSDFSDRIRAGLPLSKSQKP